MSNPSTTIFFSKMTKQTNTFAERLRSLREMSGLTQSELARKAGCQPSSIAHMEAGRREPSLENLTKIVKALGVAADVLLGTARP